MKTVLVDNSLCVYSLNDNADPEHIYNYLESLAKAGVRYVEIDFRAVMNLRALPKGIGYIFRMVDPMFLRLTEVYNFDYVLLTLADMNKKIKTDVPVMLEIPMLENVSGNIVHYAENMIDGRVTAIRLRGSHEMMERKEAAAYVRKMKNAITVPIDILPMNEHRSALDCAVKFSMAGIDSLTLTMGLPERYCSLEEFFFTLMATYDMLPNELNISGICRASVYQRYIFRNSEVNGIMRLMDMLDHDIHFLQNIDTGKRVPMRISLKDTEYIERSFTSALQKMAANEDIPDDIFEELSAAIKHFNTDVYNEELLNRKRTGLLN